MPVGATISSDQANNILTALAKRAHDDKANNLFAVAQVYYGLGTQPSAFNFDSALAGVRGPG